MGFVEHTLEPGEQLVYKAHRHWIIFVIPVALFVVAGILLQQMQLLDSPLACGIVFLFPVIKFLQACVQYFASEFSVTSNRLLMKTGLFRRTVYEIPHSKVAGVGFKQNILGSLMNFGTIVIASTGETKIDFRNVSAPKQFAEQALNLSTAARPT
ncbi:MAG: PH domain-containing protein [Deltaproteobacteria bacterium]|nr:PH domain-containing protein [Deltaproteobacteria bacterium]